jgi:transposase
MAKPLSEDLRIRVVRAVEGGMSRRAAAERFGISVSSAVRYVRGRQEPSGKAATSAPTALRSTMKRS